MNVLLILHNGKPITDYIGSFNEYEELINKTYLEYFEYIQPYFHKRHIKVSECVIVTEENKMQYPEYLI